MAPFRKLNEIVLERLWAALCTVATKWPIRALASRLPRPLDGRGMLPAMPSTSLPRRFRSFSLRTLMVLFTMACIGAAWLATEWRFVRERRSARLAWTEAVMIVRSADGSATIASGRMVAALGTGRPHVYGGNAAAELPFIRKMFGDMPVHEIQVPGHAGGVGDPAALVRLFPEAKISDYRRMVESPPSRSPSP